MSATLAALKPRSFTGRFEVDVFISYGHIDNQEDWVTLFHARLMTRLQELLGTDNIAIWRDLKLNGNDVFESVLKEKVSRSAVFISILSPRYCQSPSCHKELDWFMEAAQQTGGLRLDTKSRLIHVTKTRLQSDPCPGNFDGTLGFEFYETDKEDTDLFYEFSAQPNMPRYTQFRERCDRVAQAVERLLRGLKQAPAEAAANSRTVYLARTTSDLEPRLTAIRNELIDRGHTVLPSEPLPECGPEIKEMLQPLLAKCDLSVHLFGRSYGIIPEAETRSFGELQYELCFAQRQRPGFHQLVWIPEDLNNPEERQSAFLNRLRESEDKSAGDHADLYETSFESFKEGLLDVLSKKPTTIPAAGRGSSKAIYLLCNQADLKREPLDQIKSYLRQRGHPVELPPFDGDPEELRELEQELISDTDAALIYYGTAKDAWIMAKRKMLRKALGTRDAGKGYGRAIYLCAPKDDKKSDYLSSPGHLFLEPEPQGLPPLLVVGDCGEFEAGKLDAFVSMIE